MLWLAAYLTGFPPAGLYALCWTHGLAPRALSDIETVIFPYGFHGERKSIYDEVMRRLRDEEIIFDEQLPASEYKQKYDLAIEVLHLWTDHDLRQKNRYYEVWIPVELKK